MEEESWKKVSIRCPVCGKKIVGYKSKSNSVKFSCLNCKTTMISTIKGEDKFIHILPQAK